MTRRFDAILFDLGSTLIYFDGPLPEIIAQADVELVRHLQAAGLHLEPEAFTRRFEALLDAYYAQREAEFIEYTTAYIIKSLLQEWGYADPQDQIARSALQ